MKIPAVKLPLARDCEHCITQTEVKTKVKTEVKNWTAESRDHAAVRVQLWAGELTIKIIARSEGGYVSWSRTPPKNFPGMRE